MKFITKKKKTLFDGDQELLYTRAHNFNCPSCMAPISINPAELKNCTQLSRDEIDFVVSNIKGLKVVNLGEDVFIKINCLPLNFIRFSCDRCGIEHLGFFGIGEYQPARFMLVQAAIAVSS